MLLDETTVCTAGIEALRYENGPTFEKRAVSSPESARVPAVPGILYRVGISCAKNLDVLRRPRPIGAQFLRSSMLAAAHFTTFSVTSIFTTSPVTGSVEATVWIVWPSRRMG